MPDSNSRPKRNVLRNILIVLVVVIVAIRLALPVIVVKTANRLLPDILKTDVHVGDIDLSLLGGYVSVKDFVVEQPSGFEGSPLLSVPFLSVKLGVRSLLSKPIMIQRITLRDASVYLQRDKEGQMNTGLLGEKKPAGESAPGGEVSEGEIEPSEKAEGQSEPVDLSVILEQLNVENLSFAMIDRSYEKPLRVDLSPIDISVTNVIFDPSRSDEEVLPGGVLITAKMLQAPLGTGHIGVKAKVGILGADVPALNGVVRVSGVELGPLSSVVPAGVSQALGGNCLDVHADIAMAPDLLDVKAGVKSAGANLGIGVSGTPREPKPDTSSALFAVFGRFGGSVGNLVGNVGGAGMEAGEAAVQTVGAVGMGAAKTVGALGKGIFKTVKGAATADLSEMGEGLKGATVGTIGEAAGTVTDAAKELGQGVAATGSATVGLDSAGAWRTESEERWNREWEKAEDILATMPFPKSKKDLQSESGGKSANKSPRVEVREPDAE
ncbi:MAG: hypothetical protein KJ626_14680 [Verrucomicrobia bacterium]|nr:hypothetical protein [Verrucomicrobiota bacterium]